MPLADIPVWQIPSLTLLGPPCGLAIIGRVGCDRAAAGQPGAVGDVQRKADDKPSLSSGNNDAYSSVIVPSWRIDACLLKPSFDQWRSVDRLTAAPSLWVWISQSRDQRPIIP